MRFDHCRRGCADDRAARAIWFGESLCIRQSGHGNRSRSQQIPIERYSSSALKRANLDESGRHSRKCASWRASISPPAATLPRAREEESCGANLCFPRDRAAGLSVGNFEIDQPAKTPSHRYPLIVQADCQGDVPHRSRAASAGRTGHRRASWRNDLQDYVHCPDRFRRHEEGDVFTATGRRSMARFDVSIITKPAALPRGHRTRQAVFPNLGEGSQQNVLRPRPGH